MGEWVQVSCLGMPLTNEAVIPIVSKDFWNAITSYAELAELSLDEYFYNPELALCMDDALFGSAVPSLSALRVQRNSPQSFDFGNLQDGLYSLKGSPAVAGTALDDSCDDGLIRPKELEFMELLASGEELVADMEIYPNPTKGKTTFSLSGFGQETFLEIFDWTERLIFRRVVSADENQQVNLNLQALRISSGIYVVVARSGDQIVSKKLTLH